MSSTEGMSVLANPHAVATIIEASAKRTIVASQDIVDERGVKLWAGGQPVSESLQQRLLERKLKQPLEACLKADDGVDAAELQEAMDALLASDHPIASAVRPWATRISHGLRDLPLHSVPQLLLTAVHASKPAVFDHAVRGMALAGAMSTSTGADQHQLRMALLGGLLHDLGEMYIDPKYLDTTAPLDTIGYRHLAVHPRIGAMLLSTLTDYPPMLPTAIAEHHERLDGSGYPARSAGKAVSPLGRLLAVVEMTLGIAGSSKAPWTHASFALRMVPGEFDNAWVGFVTMAARQAAEDLNAATSNPGDQAQSIHDQLALVNERLNAAVLQASTIDGMAKSLMLRDIASHAVHLLQRLRTGWNAMGMWATAQADDLPEARFELHMACRELSYRLRFIRRECLWTMKEMDPADEQMLEPLWALMEQPLR